jgi:hypothetical protein
LTSMKLSGVVQEGKIKTMTWTTPVHKLSMWTPKPSWHHTGH